MARARRSALASTPAMLLRAGMPLCFAYGANMDRAAMAGRCPGSRPLGVARLLRHRFVVTADGYASVIRDPRATVHGVLWDLSLADVAALDRFESVATGLYTKALQSVVGPEGPRRALVYFGRSREPGAPKPNYLEGVVAAAREWALPSDYIQEIERLGAGGGARLRTGLGGPRTPRR